MNSPPKRPPPAPRVPIPLWQKIIIGITTLLFLGICTIVVAPEPPPDPETPLEQAPASLTTEPGPTPTSEPQLTGQEIFTCLLDTKTSIADRLLCEKQRDFSALTAAIMTNFETSDLPSAQRAELEKAITMIDDLNTSIGELMAQSPAPHILCQGPLPDYRDTFLTLRDYRDSNTDLEVVYLDYQLASAGYFIQELDENCASYGLHLPPP